jgi:hypothetical protein
LSEDLACEFLAFTVLQLLITYFKFNEKYRSTIGYYSGMGSMY